MFAASKKGKSGGRWQLPVFMQAEIGQQKASLVREIEQWRRQCGLHERRLA
jgi:hypothetical protein